MTDHLGGISPNRWQRIDPNVEGAYSPIGTYTGNPTVSFTP